MSLYVAEGIDPSTLGFSHNFDIGHIISGGFNIIVGAVHLIALVRRWTKHQEQNNSQQTYCEAHVPERDKKLLTYFGGCTALFTTLGIIYECRCMWLHHRSFSCMALAHHSLYASYGFMGFVAMIEGITSHRALPPDSWRAALLVANLCAAFQWHRHAMMKTDMAEMVLHELMSQICWAWSAITVFSIYRPQHLIPYALSSSGCFILMGLWMLVAGYDHTSNAMPSHDIAPLFSMLLTTLGAITAGAVAYLRWKYNITDTPSDRPDVKSESYAGVNQSEERGSILLDSGGLI